MGKHHDNAPILVQGTENLDQDQRSQQLQKRINEVAYQKKKKRPLTFF